MSTIKKLKNPSIEELEMVKLDELKEEAKELGVEFSPNIGLMKLQEKVDAYYKAQETNSKAVDAAIKANETAEPAAVVNEKDPKVMMRKVGIELEKAARKMHIITVTDNDQRVNNQTTTWNANCENELFSLPTRIMPLNMPVEAMQGYIDNLKEVEIPLHVKDPRTGLSRVESRKRYAISYEQQK